MSDDVSLSDLLDLSGLPTNAPGRFPGIGDVRPPETSWRKVSPQPDPAKTGPTAEDPVPTWPPLRRLFPEHPNPSPNLRRPWTSCWPNSTR